MKLSQILEAKDRHIIKNTSENMSKLKTIITKYQDLKILTGLTRVFQNPSIKTWNSNSWILDQTLNLITNDTKLSDSQKQEDTELIKQLKTTRAPIIVSSLYNIPKKELKDTPLNTVSFSDIEKKKIKKALGPLGYITALSSADKIPHNILKKTLNDIAKDSDKISKDVKYSIPDIKIIKDF
jgi:hypothetical protein